MRMYWFGCSATRRPMSIIWRLVVTAIVTRVSCLCALGSQAVLQAYSAVRQPRAQGVWDASYRAGSTYHLQGPHGATKEGLCEDLKDMWKPVWHYDFDSDVNSAVDLLHRSGAF